MQSSIFSALTWNDLTFYTVDLFYYGYYYFFKVGLFYGDYIFGFIYYNLGLLTELWEHF